MSNLQAESKHHERDVQLNGRVPSLVLYGGAITGPLAHCGAPELGSPQTYKIPQEQGLEHTSS